MTHLNLLKYVRIELGIGTLEVTNVSLRNGVVLTALKMAAVRLLLKKSGLDILA